MKHIFLDRCESTQSSFKEYWAQHSGHTSQLLVSTQEQTGGIGRRGNSWFSNSHSLSMSFSFKSQSILSLTPLHIAVALCEFFHLKNIPLKLKWPNDILDHNGNKLGGILCQVIDQETVLVGVGLNLYLDEQDKQAMENIPYEVGHLNLKNIDKKVLAEDLYKSLLGQNDFQFENWNKFCHHIDKVVTIVDGEQKVEGIFVGIDKDGAALVKSNDKTHRVLTGSLRVSSRLG